MRTLSLLVLALVGLAPIPALAEDLGSPVGRWRTIDDSTHRPKSVVRLWEKDNVIYGNIESLFREPGEEQDPICSKCEGSMKNKPIKGLLFMWGFKKDGDEWSGGRIVDPDNGKVYRCWLKVTGKGMRLKVRGYVGVSLFGRTQTWERVLETPPPAT